ncbi:hypothetical protein EV201_1614 [Ancylomarina subtilis]|uniref:Uncharacterized protein n=1 Tax=Ancylomarina subtilis TaxID=1639035 RepID=A0A4Q7VLL6_9BACT|nr:hypothetical protein EV201_1614 [Ancylomarina subtilis]
MNSRSINSEIKKGAQGPFCNKIDIKLIISHLQENLYNDFQK